MKKKLLLAFALLATHNMLCMQGLEVAALADHVIPNILGVAPSNIQAVTSTNVRNGEGYYATLTNGKSLFAYKQQNQPPQCIITHGGFMTPMTEGNSLFYYRYLKELHNQQQHA